MSSIFTITRRVSVTTPYAFTPADLFRDRDILVVDSIPSRSEEVFDFFRDVVDVTGTVEKNTTFDFVLGKNNCGVTDDDVVQELADRRFCTPRMACSVLACMAQMRPGHGFASIGCAHELYVGRGVVRICYDPRYPHCRIGGRPYSTTRRQMGSFVIWPV